MQMKSSPFSIECSSISCEVVGGVSIGHSEKVKNENVLEEEGTKHLKRCCHILMQLFSEWYKEAYVKNWTICYLLIWMVLTLFSPDPRYYPLLILFAKLAIWTTVTEICCKSCRQCFPSSRTIRSFIMRRSYVLGISILFFLLNPGIYSNTFYFFKPSSTMERILKQLNYNEPDWSHTTSTERISDDMQALYIGNGYAKKLGHALWEHFDKFGRNETDSYDYVKTLNLIGNVFDDVGVGFIAHALDHPFAYTESVLLGRNENINDLCALRFAKSIISSDKMKKLTWLSMDSTSVTEKGISELFRTMGTRPSSSLSFNYMKPQMNVLRYLLPSFIYSFINPVAKSLKNLHKATKLDSLDLVGNSLGDQEMEDLAKAVLKTNITSLNLVNNKIGPRGIFHLLPLTTQLRELDVGINKKVGDEGAILLSNALKDPKSSIESLQLWKCNIGELGADALLSTFPNNTRLKFLSLTLGNDYSKIAMDTIKALKEATQKNWNSR